MKIRKVNKPKWHIQFRLLKNSLFSFEFRKTICKELLWKDKFNSPRVENIPKYLFSWLWFQLDIIQGNDDDWEWYLWVEKYSNCDIDKAVETFPWMKMVDGKYIKYNPNLTYNLKRND